MEYNQLLTEFSCPPPLKKRLEQDVECESFLTSFNNCWRPVWSGTFPLIMEKKLNSLSKLGTGLERSVMPGTRALWSWWFGSWELVFPHLFEGLRLCVSRFLSTWSIAHLKCLLPSVLFVQHCWMCFLLILSHSPWELYIRIRTS